MAGIVWHPTAKRQQLEDAGPFTGGGHKFLVHTTEGSTLESAFDTVKAKRSSPHFILEVKDGRRRLVQCIPIDRAARGLEHPGGTPETNHANCIQVEVVGFTEFKKAKQLGHLELWVPNWSQDVYKFLHLLMVWTHDHFAVPMRADHPFIGQPGYARLSGQAFVDAVGLVGHCHVANNDHTDPGPLQTSFVINGPGTSFGPTH
jgi:hypothetical protein